MKLSYSERPQICPTPHRKQTQEDQLQLIYEQHGFEMHRSTDIWIVFNKYTGNLGDLQPLEKTFLLTMNIVYNTYNYQNMC